MEKNWISTSFSLEKLRFRLENTVSDLKYTFPREKLVFGVETGIFLRRRVFLMEKNGIWKFFSRKTEVSIVKYYFRCKVLSRENFVFDVKTSIFLTKRFFLMEKTGFQQVFL